MFRRRTISRLRSAVRSSLTVTMLAGLLIGTIGFPAPPPGMLGSAFPCEGHGCGCRSAEECWLGCCCLTPAQRLAWAKEHDVTPPAEVVRLAAREQPATRAIAACCSGDSRTTADAKPACCGHAAAKTCDAKTACCAASHEHAVAVSDEAESAPVFAPRRCRGTGHGWVTAGQPFALPERPATFVEFTVSEPVLTASPLYALDAASPPTRPG